VFATIPRSVVQAFIAQIYVVVVWHIFRGGLTVEGGTKIKEMTCAFVQEILARISRILAQIFEEEAWHGFRDKSVLNF
jgi:hypothetical protein